MNKTKYIILGDLHFGIKQGSIEFYENTQLPFFREQLIPYILNNNINTIIQLGDFLDNRTQLNIALWERIKVDILDVLKDNNITVYTILGNHDITLRESLDISFMYTVNELFSNIVLINSPKFIDINDNKCLLQPWLCSGESINPIDLTSSDYIFGHFETTGFLMVKGQVCSSGINPELFSTDRLKKVYSGHFHLRSIKGKIEYVGTPYPLNWNDYNVKNGFVVFDGDNEEFIQNTVSSKFIKIKYNDSNYPNEDYIEIKGLYQDSLFCNIDTIPYDELLKHNIKFFINHSDTSHFEEVIYRLKEHKIQFTVTNSVEIGNLINCDYSTKINDKLDTHEFILEAIDKKDNELVELLKSIMTEARTLEV